MKNILLSSALFALIAGPAMATEKCKGHRINPLTGDCIQYKSHHTQDTPKYQAVDDTSYDTHESTDNSMKSPRYDIWGGEYFAVYDRDHDGVITKAEYLSVAEEQFDDLDKDASGMISKDEANKLREVPVKVKPRWEKRKHLPLEEMDKNLNE